MSNSLAVCDHALPVVPRATANTAAIIHLRGIFIRPTSFNAFYFTWETLHLVIVRASSKALTQCKHELCELHDDLIRNFPFES